MVHTVKRRTEESSRPPPDPSRKLSARLWHIEIKFQNYLFWYFQFCYFGTIESLYTYFLSWAGCNGIPH